MTTPADEAPRQAPSRGESEAARHTDPLVCAPSDLARLIGHPDPHTSHLGLVLLRERVTSARWDEGSEGAELAGLLPPDVAAPPEAALVQAELYGRLAQHVPARRWPAWRTAELPMPVRIAWLRAELLHRPEAVRTQPRDELLYQALRETRALDAPGPERLVSELADTDDPVVQGEALRLLREGLHAGLLRPSLVRARLSALLGAAGDGVVAGALSELAEPWAALEPFPLPRLAPFLTPLSSAARPEGAAAALAAAARHGHADLLRQVAEDTGLPPALRQRSVELLGDLAERDDIGALTALAGTDPLLLGRPVLTCLSGLHRRGHFAQDEDVPAVVALALTDHSIPADEVATVLFTCRRAVLRELTETAPDDRSPRRLDLLVALAAQGAGDLPVGEAVTRLLPLAARPEPFLDAIRALRYTDAEETVLGLLPSAPAAALRTLEAIGGRRTVEVLAQGIGLGKEELASASGSANSAANPAAGSQGDGDAAAVVPHLRAVRHHALEVLWLLNEDPELRRRILGRLDPTDLPDRVAADLGGPDDRELALLSSHLDPARPVTALCRLAANGNAATLPVLADLLLRIVAEVADRRDPDGREPASPQPTADARHDVRPPAEPRSAEPRSAGTRHDGRPGGEPVVPQEALDALHALGGRLHVRGRIRPVCLLDAAGPREAGDALVATLALELLERPGLSDIERTVLLDVLLRTPHAHTRPQVHRLLRHRDRHIRKHVIALLARDTSGTDARALSATLIPLTAAEDIQTVRQALLALGQAGARWAAGAIAACLDRPTMNIKKTAAEVLVRAGGPEAVPKLLLWLGRHDNPGLRASLTEALRAVLGDAYAATLIAAAEREDDGRTRDLLLAGLDGVLPARSLLALDTQRSPAAPVLLALAVTGRVRLASGTLAEITGAAARHGVVAPGRRPGPEETTDTEIASLLTGGWDPAIALRIAERQEPPSLDRLRELRPLLGDWLRLAASSPRPAVRGRILRLTLSLCPAPWTPVELAAFARSADIVLDQLTHASDADRAGLLAVLDAVAPELPAVKRPVVAAAVRALPPAPGAGRVTLALLRRCGAVLVRGDLDSALAAARLGGDPWEAETAVLREAFAVPPPTEQAANPAWPAALDAAVQTSDALEEFRRSPHAPGSRELLAALIGAHAGAVPEVRAALVDRMTELQPLGAPPWTIAESAAAPAPDARTVHGDDLDQPRSAALRRRLLALLDAPEADRRDAAARALVDWPEPGVRLDVLRAYLRGRVTVPPGPGSLRALDAAELSAEGILPDRAVALALLLDPDDPTALLPLLLGWWEHGPAAIRPQAARALRRVPADVLAGHLDDRLAAGAWGYLDLLAGRPLLRTPALTRLDARLRAEGRADLADELRLVDGPLRGPDAPHDDAAALAALRERPATARPRRPAARTELPALAHTGSPDEIRRALLRLIEEQEGPGSVEHTGRAAEEDRGLREVIGALLEHPRTKVRLQAYRTSRAVFDRETHLGHVSVLLHDPQPDVRRMAVRAVCHARWTPAIPVVTGLLEHPHPVVRTAAADGLALWGTPAASALRHALDHARPDKRSVYRDVLDRITGGGVTPG
ncbi:HEAT repeat domain-containing protein [Streptomyces sp. NBC_00306]|uniref:HEAT repeat domain-containing protein n=1 Tax=Streptomyces sp. NBC_00306 TaxID=2975708 RepID=UPI002E2B0BE9|nr:HEAT repeat domain-containing protein [Streptomyces sp. NBC_00306]